MVCRIYKNKRFSGSKGDTMAIKNSISVENALKSFQKRANRKTKRGWPNLNK